VKVGGGVGVGDGRAPHRPTPGAGGDGGGGGRATFGVSRRKYRWKRHPLGCDMRHTHFFHYALPAY